MGLAGRERNAIPPRGGRAGGPRLSGRTAFGSLLGSGAGIEGDYAMNENLFTPDSSRTIFTRRTLLGRGAAAAAFAVGGLRLVRAFAAETETVFQTTAGKVRGTVSNGLNIFKGVPYGASTEGAARFLPPQKPKPWAGVKDALEYGPRAWQGRPGNTPAAAP